MRDFAPAFAELRAAARTPERALTLPVTGVRRWAGSLRDAGSLVAFLDDVLALPVLGLAGLIDPLADTALGPAPDGAVHAAGETDTWASPAEPPAVARDGGFPGDRHGAGLDPIPGALPGLAGRSDAGAARSSRHAGLGPGLRTSTWALGGNVRFNDAHPPYERAPAPGRAPVGPPIPPGPSLAPGRSDPASGVPDRARAGRTRPVDPRAASAGPRAQASDSWLDRPPASPRHGGGAQASLRGVLARFEGGGEVAGRPLAFGGPNSGSTGAGRTTRLPRPGPEPSPGGATGRHRSDPTPTSRSPTPPARLPEASRDAGRAPSQPAAGAEVPGMAQVVRLLEDLVGKLGTIGARLAEAGQRDAGLNGSEPVVRWLEDDELAGRLQRILMRQARSRGIDLS